MRFASYFVSYITGQNTFLTIPLAPCLSGGLLVAWLQAPPASARQALGQGSQGGAACICRRCLAGLGDCPR